MDQHKIKTSIVILNWNGKKYLEKFLPLVIRNSQIPGVEVVVADNGSTDSSVSYLEENFPSVKIIKFDNNYGFTGGYNRALQQVDSEYYVILNSDIETPERWLEPLINHMDNNPNTVACQPKIIAYHDKKSFEYAGGGGGYLDFLGYPFCRGRILDTIEVDEGQYDNCTDIFWATGACLFVRAEAFHRLGRFDDDFFAHMEEIDLCWRFKNSGYDIKCITDSTIYHVGGGTLPNDNPKKLYLNFRNNLYLLFKNLPGTKLIFVFAMRLILDGIAGLKFLLTGKTGFFWAVIRAHLGFYRRFISVIVKRRRCNKFCRTHNHKEIYKRSIVFDYFIKKRTKFSDLDM